jgi:hypothetical protein
LIDQATNVVIRTLPKSEFASQLYMTTKFRSVTFDRPVVERYGGAPYVIGRASAVEKQMPHLRALRSL